MEGLLYILGSGFVLYLVYKFARQLFYKILIIALIIGAAFFGLYYFKIGPFQQNVAHISTLKAQYCDGEQTEICDCIVAKLEKDLNQRFSAEEIEAMKEDRVQCAYVFQKSMSQISEEAKACLKSYQKEHLWKTFIKETLQIDNAVTDKLESLFQEGKTAIDEKINETKDTKKGIDDRY